MVKKVCDCLMFFSAGASMANSGHYYVDGNYPGAVLRIVIAVMFVAIGWISVRE